MNFPIAKTKKTVTVECRKCRTEEEVRPEKIPFQCRLCKSLMYPKRMWEIKK